MTEVIITLYGNRDKKTAAMEKFLKKHAVAYVKHEKPMPKYDKRCERPYLIFGDPKGTPLGPTSNLAGIESTIKRLSSSSE